MPLKPHPTDPDKMVYESRYYDIPELQGVTTTPQRTWVGLTDEEIDDIANSILADDPVLWWRKLSQDIEAKLKEKNA